MNEVLTHGPLAFKLWGSNPPARHGFSRFLYVYPPNLVRAAGLIVELIVAGSYNTVFFSIYSRALLVGYRNMDNPPHFSQ